MTDSPTPRDAVTEMQRYYAERAPEYDRVYDKPERQADIAVLRAALPTFFSGRRVLEVACGTGYWTQHIAPAAAQLTALDMAPETMAIAAQRVPAERVRFRQGDAYALPDDLRGFDTAFAGFWFSHVPVARQRAFLQGLHRCLAPGAEVVLIDNRYVPGSNHPITETDADGNTYQTRQLTDGSVHRVMKNFPTREALAALIAEVGTPIANPPAVEAMAYYWCFRYRLKA